MVDKKVIILSTVAIILMIILVFICFGSNLSVFKQETDLVITSNSTLNNGDNFTVELADNNGKGIANKTVCIKLVDDGGNVNNLNITTDKNGVSSFGINANSGNYVAKCVFLGDDNYDSSNIVQNISIINKVVSLNQTDNVNSNSSDNSQNNGVSKSDDNYQRPTTMQGGKEQFTAHESDVMPDGWDPNKHELYRVNLPDGNHRIYYDDGYKRVCDSHGYVLSWGY